MQTPPGAPLRELLWRRQPHLTLPGDPPIGHRISTPCSWLIAGHLSLVASGWLRVHTSLPRHRHIGLPSSFRHGELELMSATDHPQDTSLSNSDVRLNLTLDK
jgi:hypothetical protein